MERITMSIAEDLARAFDELIAARGYASRSEAMRDLLRREIEARRQAEEGPKSLCVASFSYVYDHHVRDLADRINAAQHAHHDLVVSTMHVHLDHEHCLETAILKGTAARVRAFADSIEAERGVRHARLHLISVEAGDAHRMPGAHHHHGHMHLVPRS
ncbi:MAG: nickel-responsive transcriptional regulator NikR [Betaproteobacteria bacterium]|nr:nickel-responsive transcriptional regulator NikR [Betaproteobacteria bacterium]